MSTSYGVGRKYYTMLLFHDHTFWDPKDNSGWEIYGEQKWMVGGYAREPVDNSMAARCDLEKGKWNGIDETLPVTNNSFSSVAPGGYLYHRTPITVNNEFGSIACWFKIRSEDAQEFYGDKRYHITLMGWENYDNVDMRVEIRARDNTNPLIECVKIYYGTTYKQVYLPEPILNDTWYHFVHTVYQDRDLYFINGIKILDQYTGRNNDTTPIKFNSIKIGAYDDWSSGGLTIDEFVTMNDFYSDNDFFNTDKPIQWIHPEMLHLDELNEEKGLYFQMGSMLRFNYILYAPEGKKGNKLTFNKAQGIPFAMFKDNVKMPESSWTGNVREVTLLNPTDVADIFTSFFILVTIVKFIPDNLKEEIMGASLFDHVLHPIRITRISYWVPPENAVINMYNKIEWYKNNKIPASNFDYIDKFKIQWKE